MSRKYSPDFVEPCINILVYDVITNVEAGMNFLGFQNSAEALLNFSQN